MIRLERPIRIEDPRARGWASPYIETICADRRAVWFGRWHMTYADALTLAAAIDEAVAEATDGVLGVPPIGTLRERK